MKIQNQALYNLYFAFLIGPGGAIAPPGPSIATSLPTVMYSGAYKRLDKRRKK